MSSERQAVTVRDLVDEAKKRIVLLVICVVGLSYLMSLTSPSVIVNVPVATFLLITLRYLSLDLDMRRKAATYKSKPTSANNGNWSKPFEDLTLAGRDNWKHKVNSPVVEDAIGQFTGHIVSEWVTDLWYSRITPDRQVPEELLLIINGVFGEISTRMRNINLIDLLTRDIINLLCSRLELFRYCKNKIEKKQSRFFTTTERDVELKVVLAAENKLHPALFSAEAEHKVLQHVMDGLILFTFKPEDLRCSLFRYTVRELLACAVMRPVLNLANPRFINERIESLIISSSKSDKGSKESSTASGSRMDGSSKIPNHISGFPDPSVKGVELVPLKKDQNKKDTDYASSNNVSGMLLSKDPLVSMDAQSTLSLDSVPESHNSEGKGIQRHRFGGEWGDMLDVFSRRKNEALTPEHLDNLWTKGRGYRKEEINQLAVQVRRNSVVGVSNSVEQPQRLSEQKKTEWDTMGSFMEKNISNSGYSKCPQPSTTSLYEEANEHGSVPSDGVESWSSSYTDDEDTNNITGLDSPAIKVWDGKNKRNFSHIHHPLETFEGHKNGKANKACRHSRKLHGTRSAKKRLRSSIHDEIGWQEAERTSSLLREMQRKENLSCVNVIPGGGLSEDSEAEHTDRICSGATTTSSMSLASLPQSHSLAAKSAKNSIIANSFFRLRCEVIGANIVKSGSKTFAIYSVSVTDVNNNNWSIKRRFRHFEELHRRLKDFPEYNLHLPPKHFLSTGLDVLIIQERSKLLDQYLKKLLQLPTVSCSIEVWDFLSVDSQMYIFSNSLSIIDTISVDRDATVSEKRKENWDTAGPLHDAFSSEKENGSQTQIKGQALSSSKKPEPSNNSENADQNKTSSARNLGRIIDRDQQALHSIETSDMALSSEWIPPNLSVPILDLVDVVLQLNDGGWIRRKAFWAAKQVLQLGMGDAFDDWLIEKIQLLRQGSVVASGIRRLEQILWPDGIFITKHPTQQNPSPASPSDDFPGHQPSNPHSLHKIDDTQNLEEMQQKEAEQRAKLVYDIMIDKAPAAIVSLVGRKEYDLCAKDLYDFIQSSVCMKQLAFDLLQLLLLSAFPELGDAFRQLEEEKDKFGKLELN